MTYDAYDETVREFAEYFKVDEKQIRDIMSRFLALNYFEAEEQMDPYDRAVGHSIYRVVKLKSACRMTRKSRKLWRRRAMELGSPGYLVDLSSSTDPDASPTT